MHEYVACSWYEVNYGNAEQLRYGQNLGCSFSEENCLTYGYVNLMHNYTNNVYWCFHACCCYNYMRGWISLWQYAHRHVKFTCMHRNLIPSSFHVDWQQLPSAANFSTQITLQDIMEVTVVVTMIGGRWVRALCLMMPALLRNTRWECACSVTHAVRQSLLFKRLLLHNILCQW